MINLKSIIRDHNIWESGSQKISWVESHMPILNKIEEEFIKEKPLLGLNIAISIHIEAKTAYFSKVLKSGGANVALTASNPLSTQDDVAAALVRDGVHVFGWHNASKEEYQNHLHAALDIKPDIIIDDGGDLIQALHSSRQELFQYLKGGCEQTTTGILRLKSMEQEGRLHIPMVAVNNSYCMQLFDNHYGTGQSVWDGINRTTNLIVAGKNVVIAGYGWCGKGVAMRARGLGANVFITEVDEIKCVEAMMDGFEVKTMEEVASFGDLFITATGCKDVITREHFEKMKHGTVICNAGHSDVEISKTDLESMAREKKVQRNNIMGYRMPTGKWIHLLVEGRLVNLASGDGHPAEIMDMSFALQALSAVHLVRNYYSLGRRVIDVPEEIDRRVAKMKLEAWGIKINSLTKAQKEYMNHWKA